MVIQKRKNWALPSLIFSVIILSHGACVNHDLDGPVIVSCTDSKAISFESDVKPIINSNCALSGCHATGAHAPDLTADNAYAALNNGIFVNTLIPKQSKLYIEVNGEMGTYMPSPLDKRKVYDWIRNGAPNN